ncbi:MAG: hypothetical protein ACNA7Y_01935 [Gammaproteobacteria bacterium]
MKDDAHGELFREASVRGKLREKESEFGKVLAETDVNIIFAKLLEKLNSQNSAEQVAVMEGMEEELTGHPLLAESQAFDGMENDSNLNPDAIADPMQRQELKNRLALKNQLKKRLEKNFNPTPLITFPTR